MADSIQFSVKDMVSPALFKMISDGNRKKVLAAGGLVLARDTRLTWKESSRRPAPWPPLAEKTVRRKGHGKLLYDTGKLRDSIRMDPPTANEAKVGTDAPYAIYHQKGTGKMPARPFIPVSPEGKLTPQTERACGAAMEAAIRASLPK